ncbi:hypothetical protein [Streptomyces sp. NPDC002540]
MPEGASILFADGDGVWSPGFHSFRLRVEAPVRRLLLSVRCRCRCRAVRSAPTRTAPLHASLRSSPLCSKAVTA